jgi:hypothetical protein
MLASIQRICDHEEGFWAVLGHHGQSPVDIAGIAHTQVLQGHA